MKKILLLILVLPLLFLLKRETPLLEKTGPKPPPPPLVSKDQVEEKKDLVGPDQKSDSRTIRNFGHFNFAELDLKNIVKNKKKEFTIQLPYYGPVPLVVKQSVLKKDGRITLAGLLKKGKGIFWISPRPGVQKIGFIEMTAERRVFSLERVAGKVSLKEYPLDDFRCDRFRSADKGKNSLVMAMTKNWVPPYHGHIDTKGGYFSNSPYGQYKANTTEIGINDYKAYAYESLKGGEHVLYLDFNGHEMDSSDVWHGYNKGPKTLPFDTDGKSNIFSVGEQETIYQIWAFMAEDFYSFNINVTTDFRVFEKNPPKKRARIVFKPKTFLGGAAGVAFMNNYKYHAGATGWVFQDTADITSFMLAKVGSHEAGHMYGLGHDGRRTETAWIEYASGISKLKWGPIMGSPWRPTYSQWNNGSYPEANNKQDDAETIATLVDYRSEDFFDNYTLKNGGKQYPDISLNQSYYSFLHPRPSGEDVTKINDAEYVDVDYFQFQGNGEELEVLIHNINTNPNAIFKASLFKRGQNGHLTPLSQYQYNFSTKRFYPNVTEKSSMVVKVETDTLDAKDVGYSGSFGQYRVLVRSKGTTPVNPPTDDPNPPPPVKTKYKPIIQNKKETLILTKGKSFTLKADVKAYPPVSHYEWRLYDKINTINVHQYKSILGKSSVLTVTSIGESYHNKVIKLMAKNEVGTSFGPDISLQVIDTSPPEITKQPVGATLKIGQDYLLSVEAKGNQSVLSYQWMKNGIVIPGATSSTYLIKKATKKDQDDYTVKVSNPHGFVIGKKAYIVVEGLPLKIVKNLTSLKVDEGSAVKIPITVEGGTGNYTYYWYKNNQFLKDTSYPYYYMSMVSQKNQGTYLAIVKDGTMEVVSSPMVLTVIEKKVPSPPKGPEGKKSKVFVSCFCDKPLKDYYDLCLSTKHWTCAPIAYEVSDQRMNETIQRCIEEVKGDLKKALRVLVENDNRLLSRYDQCFEYAHPFFTKKEMKSNCEGFEKDIASFVGKENNFLNLKELLRLPESIGFCFKSFSL